MPKSAQQKQQVREAYTSLTPKQKKKHDKQKKLMDEASNREQEAAAVDVIPAARRRMGLNPRPRQGAVRALMQHEIGGGRPPSTNVRNHALRTKRRAFNAVRDEAYTLKNTLLNLQRAIDANANDPAANGWRRRFNQLLPQYEEAKQQTFTQLRALKELEAGMIAGGEEIYTPTTRFPRTGDPVEFEHQPGGGHRLVPGERVD